MAYDLAIVGAGPAGATAAIEACKLGLNVVLLDEQGTAGGQVWRAKCPAIQRAKLTPESQKGDALRAALQTSSASCRFNSRVWSIERRDDKFVLALVGPEGAHNVRATALLLASGTHERVFPVPGWTLPGVIGLGAATALVKEHLMLPGSRVVVAGTGPLLIYVAHEIVRYGGSVAAVIDLNPQSAWVRSLPALLSRPDLMLRGGLWMARLRALGVPIRSGYGIRSIEGHAGVEHVRIGRVKRDWAPLGDATEILDADAVCLGHGLSPAIEASRLLAADHIFDESQGGWRPTHDVFGRTSARGLYVAGDGAGVQGAAAAELRGRLSALGIAGDIGRIPQTAVRRISAPIKVRLKLAARFGRAMTELSRPRMGVIDAITPETLVCRCEGVTRQDLEAEIAGGGAMPNALKSATRCGMGPCGGRYCAETAALLACKAGDFDRRALGLATARPPLRPVPVGTLTGDFDYDDLPIPALSPL